MQKKLLCLAIVANIFTSGCSLPEINELFSKKQKVGTVETNNGYSAILYKTDGKIDQIIENSDSAVYYQANDNNTNTFDLVLDNYETPPYAENMTIIIGSETRQLHNIETIICDSNNAVESVKVSNNTFTEESIDEMIKSNKVKAEDSDLAYDYSYNEIPSQPSESLVYNEILAMLIIDGKPEHEGLGMAYDTIQSIKKNGISKTLNDIANQCVVYQTISTDGENIYTIFG